LQVVGLALGGGDDAPVVGAMRCGHEDRIAVGAGEQPLCGRHRGRQPVLAAQHDPDLARETGEDCVAECDRVAVEGLAERPIGPERRPDRRHRRDPEQLFQPVHR